MKILYGIQGTGNGHLSRSEILLCALEAAGAEVTCLVSGRDNIPLLNPSVLPNLEQRRGLTLALHHGRISWPGTLKSTHILEFWHDVRSLDLSAYDLILSDFEPISAWAARRQQRPCIGIGNQYSFFRPLPELNISAIFSASLRAFTPVSLAVGQHWFPVARHVLPPVLAPLRRADDLHGIYAPSGHQTDGTKGSIVVYLPHEDPDKLCALLKPFSEYQFHIFMHTRPRINYAQVHFMDPSQQRFQTYFDHCDGIITAAGFTLVSEALQAGKRLLLQPLTNHAEQQANIKILLHRFNAAAGQQAKLRYRPLYGRLTHARLTLFLCSSTPRPAQFPEVATPLARWLLGADLSAASLARLCADLWCPQPTEP